MINKKLISTAFITIIWLILIFAESSQPPLKILGLLPGLDKIAHFIVFGILGAMILTLLLQINKIVNIPYFQLTILLVMLSGIFDEFHQSFITTRNTDFLDLLADICGGLFFSFLYLKTNTKKVNI